MIWTARSYVKLAAPIGGCDSEGMDIPSAGSAAQASLPFITVVMPVRNEAGFIERILAELLDQDYPRELYEIIVADGGSSDGTNRLAAGFCDRLVESERGRGMQMNTGARAARGEILWFVHVDAKLPLQCLDEIRRIMDDPNVVGGYRDCKSKARIHVRVVDGSVRCSQSVVVPNHSSFPTK